MANSLNTANAVPLRLLSPQDYSIETVLAHIAPDSRLPFLCAERGHHEVNESKETRCHCHVTSVYDVRNTNVLAAQKRLKLDHDRLGHLSMQLIQKLYQPEDQSMPDFDGHPTSGLPCLLARDFAKLKCTIPLCEACELARARKRPTPHWSNDQDSCTRNC
eukprot:scaffold5066_cov173-Amphora_coffeaeformis.AAC.1